MAEAKWPRRPRPNPDVIQALEGALAAARAGLVEAVVIVAINRLLEAEEVAAGTLDGPAKFAMIGGLSSAAHKLIARR